VKTAVHAKALIPTFIREPFLNRPDTNDSRACLARLSHRLPEHSYIFSLRVFLYCSHHHTRLSVSSKLLESEGYDHRMSDASLFAAKTNGCRYLIVKNMVTRNMKSLWHPEAFCLHLVNC
jgi:hypothetical protein